jgi:tRNA (guanine-N7-)-methyltransferase
LSHRRDLDVGLPGRYALWVDASEEPARFDWDRVFGRRARRILDIGSGDGRFLLESARLRPDCDHLGIELVGPLAARGALEARRRGLANVEFVSADAVAWLGNRGQEASIDEIHVYHPQPYFDPREAGRGMLTAKFFERLWEVLVPGGLLVLQTDDPRLGRYLLAACRNHFIPEIRPGPWPGAPEGRTRREAVALRKKRTVLRIEAPRRDVPAGAAPPPPFFVAGRPGLRTVRSGRRRTGGALPEAPSRPSGRAGGTNG